MSEEKKSAGELADKKHWIIRWSTSPVKTLPFNPFGRNFRDLHQLFKRRLPGKGEIRFLEIGCYPGRYLWYFSKYFGYHVCGIEYIDRCCEETGKLLDSCGVSGRIIHADIFDYRPEAGEELWDVVASFGLIEHFKDIQAVAARHLDLVKPGGHLVLVVPNHQGIYGKIMQKVSPELYRVHRLLSREQIVEALSSDGRSEIVEAGYYGRLGLGHTGIRERLGETNSCLRFLGRALIFSVENFGRILPRSTVLSPFIAVVARKK